MGQKPSYYGGVKLSPTALLEKKLPPHRAGEVLARLASPRVRLEEDFPYEVVERFELPSRRGGGDLVRLSLPSGMSTAEGIARLEQDTRFEYVTSNDLRRPLRTTSDDYQADSLWGLEKIQAPQAWALTTGSQQGPVVAVLDTGIELHHPDLQANLWVNPGEIPGNGIDDDGNGVIDDVYGYDAVDQNGNPADDYGHGTHCAGTIGAVGNNGLGVVGVNWQTRLMSVKMMSKGEGTVADTLRALDYATRMGARITSNSYGGGYNEAEREAFENSPLLHLCAAGNESNDNDVSPFYPHQRPVGYPASYPFEHIVSVAASDRHDRLARFSNYGPGNVDLAAPGVSTLSTVPGHGYETKSGTSMATPHVAGVAALIATLYPEASNEQIRTRLLANVDTVPALQGKVASGGRLNAFKALENDTIAPGQPQGLKVEQEGAWLNLSWTSSGDDGEEGQAYRFHVEAAGARRKGPAAPSGQRQQVRVPAGPGLQRLQVRLEDNVGNLSQPAQIEVESGLRSVPLGWNSDGLWAQLPSGQWTDSPSGPYANHANSSLTSDWVSLQPSSLLRFAHRHRLEPGADYVRLEVQSRGQEDWKPLEKFTSFREWEEQHIDLGSLQGEVRFRFRLTSDGAKVEDGYWLDAPQLLTPA